MEKKKTGEVRLSRVFILVSLVCLSIFVFHQDALAAVTGKIAGRIIDAETGEPLPAVNVLLVGTGKGAATDSDGYYFIINIPPGTYEVQARMMGYVNVSKTGVEVSIDHTTPLNFELETTVIPGKGITITAGREAIEMDLASSSIVARGDEIGEMPMLTDLEEYINLTAGVEGFSIRGGGVEESSFMVDGMTIVDNRSNLPVSLPNVSSIKELRLLKGGFNAEYGNVRSGVVNVVLKEGSQREYHGSVNFNYTLPYQKHNGPSIFDPDYWLLRPYMETEDSVCWLGTDQWPDSIQMDYPEFEGWIARSEALLSDEDTTNDRTPEQCRNLFVWNHLVDVPWLDSLIPDSIWKRYDVPVYDTAGNYLGDSTYYAREPYEGPSSRRITYGDKPDWNVDVGFGGPLPIPGLGNKITFFVSHRTNWEEFAIPLSTSREYFKENNTLLKLTYHLAKDIKLSLDGLRYTNTTLPVNPKKPYAVGIRNSIQSGKQALYSNVSESVSPLWMRDYTPPYDVSRYMYGASIEHILSPSTFYDLKFTYIKTQNICRSWWGHPDEKYRSNDIIRYFGNTPVNEVPYGATYPYRNYSIFMTSAQDINPTGQRLIMSCMTYDSSRSENILLEGDLTSQINKYNQIKLGFVYHRSPLYQAIYMKRDTGVVLGNNDRGERWGADPIRIGAYIQDKIEFEGMIANIGVRLDYTDANTEWATVDPYSKYFALAHLGNPLHDSTDVPVEDVETHLLISPRLGISHPLSPNSKLYFNYGWFRSMPTTQKLFREEYDAIKRPGMKTLGNAHLGMATTVSYELGYAHQIAQTFLFQVSGYYKKATDQLSTVRYTSYTGAIDYATYEPNNYKDTRGFELTFRKVSGAPEWIDGMVSYDYRVNTSGNIGRSHYYEDIRQQRNFGLNNPEQDRTLARPIFRAYVRFNIPDWGPSLGGIKPLGDWHLSMNYFWRAGRYDTWDPLNTNLLQRNVQWRPESEFDARIEKDLLIANTRIMFFMDVNNLFDQKYLDRSSFFDNDDEDAYFSSLHLPMYEEEVYQESGYTPGNDAPGDYRSEDKPYIDMPMIEHLRFTNPRYFRLGLALSF